MNREKKKCFVITPIGEDGTTIRRHIDGIIKAAIRPALEDKYEVSAAHEHTKTGSINNQVITAIYTADLVVANLTTLNPNVMYELAVRHALKKPVIMIMEKGDVKLPFDVINERTIFYINDSQGVLDLRDEIKRVEASINPDNVSNPIYDALNNYFADERIIKILENRDDKEEATVLKVILEKINILEASISNKEYDNGYDEYGSALREFRRKYNRIKSVENLEEQNKKFLDLAEEISVFYNGFKRIISKSNKNSLQALLNKIEKEYNLNNQIMYQEDDFNEAIREKSIEDFRLIV